MLTADFDYELPGELIAQGPLPQRDQSRLLILDRSSGTISHSTFLGVNMITQLDKQTTEQTDKRFDKQTISINKLRALYIPTLDKILAIGQETVKLKTSFAPEALGRLSPFPLAV